MRIVIKNLKEKDMILKVAVTVTVWKVEILRMNIAHPGKSDILLYEMPYGITVPIDNYSIFFSFFSLKRKPKKQGGKKVKKARPDEDQSFATLDTGLTLQEDEELALKFLRASRT